MEFLYRYVKFGTAFEAAQGRRESVPGGSSEDHDRNSRQLYENELVVDVGGICWGYQGAELPVLDHHFHREQGQFPSAAAAVLHHAGQIHERFQRVSGPIWLVSHQQPDFDAYSAMYLARGILQARDPQAGWSLPHSDWEQFGIYPGAWRDTPGVREIDWFQPAAADLPDERRWAVLVAAFAGAVDNCRRTACPKSRTLDGVLYAALLRGRPYQPSGALEFFDAVRRHLQGSSRLNPFFDSVLEGSSLYAPELSLLDREVQAYERDMRRARRTVVYVQQADRPFRQWYSEIVQQPMVGTDLAPEAKHRQPAGARIAAVDGVFIRDPECLLFKNWARQDREHSSLDSGFTFTAIAYAGERAGAIRNTTNYFFALDPERAQTEGLHLYNVWAILEASELHKLATDAELMPLRMHLTPASCRPGFEGRAGEYGSLLDDPWFDGNNYACTIVATPSRGTVLGFPGTADDLSDDPVAQLVAEAVESPALAGPATVVDLSMAGTLPTRQPFPSLAAALAGLQVVPAAGYRFGRVQLADNIDPTKGQTGQQIGRLLWQLLDPGRLGVPDDFQTRHLLLAPEGVQVWSRAGIVVAGKACREESVLELERQFCKLIQLAAEVGQLAAESPAKNHQISAAVAAGRALSRSITVWRQQLSYPENRTLRRFFEATGLSHVLEAVHETNNGLAASLLGRRLDANVGYLASMQNSAEWLELFIVSFYSLELAHLIAKTLHFTEWYEGNGVLIVAGLSALTLAIGVQPWADHSPSTDEHAAYDPRHASRRLCYSLSLVILIFASFIILGLSAREREKANGEQKEPPPAATSQEH